MSQILAQSTYFVLRKNFRKSNGKAFYQIKMHKWPPNTSIIDVDNLFNTTKGVMARASKWHFRFTNKKDAYKKWTVLVLTWG